MGLRLLLPLLFLCVPSLALRAAPVGVLPLLKGHSGWEHSFLLRSAEALRAELAAEGYSVVAPTMDSATSAVLDEMNSIGDAGKVPLFEKLASLSQAEEFLLLTLRGTTLDAEWRNARGETKSGGSVRFRNNFDPDSDLLDDVLRRLVLPDLTGVPFRRTFEPVPYLVPGWGHIEKGFVLEGALLAALGASAAAVSYWGFQESSSQSLLQAGANNNTEQTYYYQRAQTAFSFALGGLLIYGLDCLWSGLTNDGLTDRKLGRMVVMGAEER